MNKKSAINNYFLVLNFSKKLAKNNFDQIVFPQHLRCLFTYKLVPSFCDWDRYEIFINPGKNNMKKIMIIDEIRKRFIVLF
jgi:hypothetical protein